MAILSGVNLSMAKEYSKYNLTTKFEGKKHKVYLKLQCGVEDLQESIDFCKSHNDVVYIEFQGDPSSIKEIDSKGVSINFLIEAGNNLDESYIDEILNEYPSFITPVFKLPDEFSNLEYLYKLNKTYTRIRFIGGNLFRINGVNIGNYDLDCLLSKGIKVNSYSRMTKDNNDILIDRNISDLDIDLVEKKKSTKGSTNISVKSNKSKSVKKPVSTRFAMNNFSLGSNW